MRQVKLTFSKATRPALENKLAQVVIDSFYLMNLKPNDKIIIKRDYHPSFKLDNITSTLNNYLLRHKLRNLFEIEITYDSDNLSSAEKIVEITKIK
jgi:hypothetical protein